MEQLTPEDDVRVAEDGGLIVAGRTYPAHEVAQTLRPFISEERAAKIEAVLRQRTILVVPVVEGLVNTGNVSAVMRTAEGLGYQQLHVVVGDGPFKRSDRTTQGADKWLDVRRWPTPGACASYLRGRGYRIVVTHLESAVTLGDVDFTQKTALVFGNEAEGVSQEMLEQADERCFIPMPGFVQSFNISVAAGIALYHAYRDRTARLGRHGDLSPLEVDQYRALHYFRSVQAADKLLARAADT